ncbi:MAG: periplasmic heavy metal sensor [Alphaproteobacteria bacterium]
MNNVNKKKYLFTISVALNLFLLGIVGGHILRAVEGQGGAPPPSSWDREKLSHNTRDLIRNTFVEKGREIREIHKDTKMKRDALKEIVVAQDFDPLAYDAAAQDLVESGNDVMVHKLDMLKGVVAKLPLEERRKVSHIFMKRLISSERGAAGKEKERFRGGNHKPPFERGMFKKEKM